MALNGTQENKLNKLRSAIKRELLKCNKAATPNLCLRISIRKGYAEIEEMIIKRCIAHRSTPTTEIGQLESELAE